MERRDQGQAPRRRRDFEESRELILEAADEAFAEDGLQVSIKAIAARAEVATATLYRHFPNKAALVRAVFEFRVDGYIDAIERAQSTADPNAAFRGTIHAIVALQAHDRFFREGVSEIDDPFADAALQRLQGPLIATVERAADEGVLRSEIEVADVLVLLTTVEAVARSIHQVSPGGLSRLVDLMLDGLCAVPQAPSSAPLTQLELFEVVSK